MILHILTQSPTTETFRQCLDAIGDGDGLLLTQNGVYAGTEQHLVATVPIQKIYALTADREARGLYSTPAGIELIDYAGFVALTLKYDKTVTW